MISHCQVGEKIFFRNNSQREKDFLKWNRRTFHVHLWRGRRGKWDRVPGPSGWAVGCLPRKLGPLRTNKTSTVLNLTLPKSRLSIFKNTGALEGNNQYTGPLLPQVAHKNPAVLTRMRRTKSTVKWPLNVTAKIRRAISANAGGRRQ